MIKTDRNYVGVKFFQDRGGMSPKTYTYWTKSKDLKEGDLVVVEVSGKYAVTRVENSSPSAAEKAKACKWVIGKVLDEKANESMKRDEDEEALIEALEARATELEKLEKFERLAKKDKRMRKLLKKLNK